MSGFTITITDAGRSALINAQNNGTTAFILSEVAVSTQHVTSGLVALTDLPNQRKRLATMAGDVVADDTLHVTIRDESEDAYALRSFGLYTSAGVLFAVYSQAEPIMEKSAAAMLLLAIDAKLVALDTAEVEFGPTGFTLPPATETIAGIAEVATDAETDAGTDNSRFITPRLLKRALQALSGFAAIGHKHDAADVETGTFSAARIPALALDKITGLVTALADKAAAVHTHTMGNIEGLTAALLGKANATHTHHADDINAGVFSIARIPALAMDKITGLADALAGRAAAIHTHTISQIEGLTSALSGKAAAAHGHIWSDISGKEDVVLTSATGLGKTGSGTLYNPTSPQQFASFPTGWTSMLPGGVAGMPVGGYSYFVKLARRDANEGYAALCLSYAGVVGQTPDVYFGTSVSSENYPDWTKVLTNADLATPAHYRSNSVNKPIATNAVWSAAEFQTVTQSAALVLDLSAGLNFKTTMTGNRNLAAPVGAKPGQSGVIEITQDGTGGRALTFDAAWKFPFGIVPQLTPAANSRDVLVFTVISAGDIVASLMKDVRR